MMKNEDFVVFILTHGRPDRVLTYRVLRKAGYTGKIYIIVDNEDETLPQYHDKYGDEVIVFDKAAVAEMTDDGDNFEDCRSPLYARNASFEIARRLGVAYFMQLDDDYNRFEYRVNDKGGYPPKHWPIKTRLDHIFDLLLDYYKSIDAKSIAMAQGGDFIAGGTSTMVLRASRKCMNSFICSTERPFQFIGKMNDDVNTYVRLGSLGNLFLTIPFVSVGQKRTQSNPGGLTELYRSMGTYAKSFYTVMYVPSCVKIAQMGQAEFRVHHHVEWEKAVPCIISEEHCKKQSKGL